MPRALNLFFSRNDTPSCRWLWTLVVTIGVAILSGGFIPPTAHAEEAQSKPAQTESEFVGAKDKEKDQFAYVFENRRDPFIPFVTEKATSNVNMDEIVDTAETLSGMQLFEPGQLTLVALLSSAKEQYAMVQDSTGKGYTVTKGTKIGKHGVITEIVPNKVIIEETTETRGGKKIVTSKTMVLKKEGEE